MKIASWNVNSIRARLPRVLEWLDGAKPDVALLQEIKTVDEGFPRLGTRSSGPRYPAKRRHFHPGRNHRWLELAIPIWP